MSRVGIVVIGRNEGQRLLECFRSIHLSDFSARVYVDSGSSDDSVEHAKSMGFELHQLDATTPFSAARARNEGAHTLFEKYPDVDFFQFLDGDCVLSPDWIRTATDFLSKNPDCAAVVGQLSERFPDASIYNLLCSLEWRTFSGEMKSFGGFGGISMIRRSVFMKLKGFNQTVIAGEEPELAVRMALAGNRIFKLPVDMATHDAAMTRFSQWWRRAVRSGHAIGQRAALNGNTDTRDCIRARKSVFAWALAVPLISLACLLTFGLSAALLPAAAYLYLGARIYKFRRTMADSLRESLIYAIFTVLAKFAELVGLAKYYYRQIFLKRFEIIEYK